MIGLGKIFCFFKNVFRFIEQSPNFPNMKRSFHLLTIILFLQLIGSPAHSQSLYEIKFSDKLKNQYTGFLVFFNETNAYVRVAYYVDNVYNVVNVSYTSRNGVNRQGDKYSMLTGYNPVFITDNKANRTIRIISSGFIIMLLKNGTHLIPRMTRC